MPTPQKYASNADRQAAYRQRQAAARQQELLKKGLPAAPAVPTMPSNARWKALTEQARAALDTCRSEIQDYFDDRSEQWQESDKGEAMQNRIDALEEIISEIDSL